MFSKKLTFVLILCVTFAFLASPFMFSSRSSLAAEDDHYKIALSVPSLSMVWFTFIKDSLKARVAKDPNVKLVTYDARNKVSKQISDVEDIITKDIDGLLISAISVKGLVPAIQKANEAGLPVVTWDRIVQNVNYGERSLLGHVGANNVEGGRMAGLYIASKLEGKGKVVEITGAPGSSPSIDRHEGFMDVIEEFPKLEVIARDTGKFRRSVGRNVMEDIITSHPNFDAVFAANDSSLMGALSAVESAGIENDQVIMQGFDAIEDGLKAIQEGRINGTIEQHPSGQIKRAYEMLVNYLRNGERPEKPVQFITPTLILKSNLEMAGKYEKIE